MAAIFVLLPHKSVGNVSDLVVLAEALFSETLTFRDILESFGISHDCGSGIGDHRSAAL